MINSRNALAALAFYIFSGAPACASSEWFTIVGDTGDAASDTVQVDPTPLAVSADSRSMRIQVSRSSPRKNWDGVPFRSYQAVVNFDCANKEARFQHVSYFMQALWTGPSHKTVEFTAANARPMRFRDMTPNPMERIVRAACAGTSGS